MFNTSIFIAKNPNSTLARDKGLDRTCKTLSNPYLINWFCRD